MIPHHSDRSHHWSKDCIHSNWLKIHTFFLKGIKLVKNLKSKYTNYNHLSYIKWLDPLVPSHRAETQKPPYSTIGRCEHFPDRFCLFPKCAIIKTYVIFNIYVTILEKDLFSRELHGENLWIISLKLCWDSHWHTGKLLQHSFHHKSFIDSNVWEGEFVWSGLSSYSFTYQTNKTKSLNLNSSHALSEAE